MELVIGLLFGLLLGWPAVLACVVITIIGLFRKDHRLLMIAGIISIPFTWFLSGFPDMKSGMFLSPLLLFIAAWTMSHKWDWVAWLFAIPFLLLIMMLFGVALQAGMAG